jgi:NAD(P)-dependent dehydrogenase (short-subunit alcohol dehydrogenase family)
MTSLLTGRVALITGGARGLGAEIAARFAAAGACGALFDLGRQLEGVEPPAGFVGAAGDVTDVQSLQRAVADVVSRFGRLDIVVANAGLVPPWRETEALDWEEWDRVMAVNVRGVAAVMSAAVPALRVQGGAVVAMASINSFTAHPRQMLYTASKHAVLGMVRAAALDLGRFDIRVNAVAPGPIATAALLGRIQARATAASRPEVALQALADRNALGRLATAGEVAKAVLFLASDLASGVTGALLPVDAGGA